MAKDDWTSKGIGNTVGRIWTKETKLKSGMTARLEIESFWIAEEAEMLNVFLTVYKKRKQIPSNDFKQTGKDGLAPLLWAKRSLVEFEEMVQYRKELYERVLIVVGWDDNRRRNVYARGLRDLGYRYGMVDGEKRLYKEV